MESTLELHRLDYGSPELANVLPEVLRLSNAIFDTDPHSKYASLEEWTRRLSAPGSIIAYLSPPSSPAHPVAFLFAHPRRHTPPLAGGETDSVHVWLAGVLPERRKEGCLARMVAVLGSAQVMTVCTTPDAYPVMWKWLMGRGWSVERDLGGGKVMLSRRTG
ncbi:uncharacterized protein B0H18DRAFT_1037845 [Fomitopsis serialis]|uniref:uncharacterized protein n=1 Tax=Fomitopsis serialis TaxID=139415 RepID=UPI002008609B|nr:uncharacterized protein B0H18DRAFT_1037845 [Neoantrodia serialis]KAH9916636.1 hypothetical protein B0H18DRAFT_1037845 [Neoantrodia serialis]